MKINLENLESVRYKITDDISIDISIIDGELNINTINKVNLEEQKKLIKERFQEICGDKPSDKTSTRNKEEWNSFITRCLSENEPNCETLKTKTQKILADNQGKILEKIHENFNTINEKAEEYAKKYKLDGTFSKIGFINEIETPNTNINEHEWKVSGNRVIPNVDVKIG